jgi:hypothetical protein
MSKFIRGALIEYGTQILGPIPNVVIFQFNPETLARTLRIPGRQVSSKSREVNQAGEAPVEQITFTASFNASDQLGDQNILARLNGIGPRLAALEKMAYPAPRSGGLISQALDSIAGALGGGASGGDPAQPIPRERYPRILFLWGPTRVLPVVIESMSITEQQYDQVLNPVRADVALTLGVIVPDQCCSDWIAKGAMKYTNLVKEVQVAANLANTAEQVVDMIPF